MRGKGGGSGGGAGEGGGGQGGGRTGGSSGDGDQHQHHHHHEGNSGSTNISSSLPRLAQRTQSLPALHGVGKSQRSAVSPAPATAAAVALPTILPAQPKRASGRRPPDQAGPTGSQNQKMRHQHQHHRKLGGGGTDGPSTHRTVVEIEQEVKALRRRLAEEEGKLEARTRRTRRANPGPTQQQRQRRQARPAHPSAPHEEVHTTTTTAAAAPAGLLHSLGVGQLGGALPQLAPTKSHRPRRRNGAGHSQAGAPEDAHRQETGLRHFGRAHAGKLGASALTERGGFLCQQTDRDESLARRQWYGRGQFPRPAGSTEGSTFSFNPTDDPSWAVEKHNPTTGKPGEALPAPHRKLTKLKLPKHRA